MARLNILSIDGGGILVLLPVLLMQRLEEVRPGFLRSADLLAGTSAGGITALILAAEDDPANGLEKCLYLWEKVPIFKVNWANVLPTITGKSALHSNQVLRSALQKILGNKRLGDLNRKVLIPTLELDNRARSVVERHWEPRLFSNFDPEHPDDSGVLAVDVALRTSAAPILFPVYQGYVDGGLFANDPAMFALAAAAWDVHRATPGRRHIRESLEDINLFSLGTGRERLYMEAPHENESWGYRHWLFNGKMPFALLEIALHCSGELLNLMCREFLGEEQHFRLNPDPKFAVHRVTDTPTPNEAPKFEKGHFDNPSEFEINNLQRVAPTVDLTEALAWTDQSTWFGSANGEVNSAEAGADADTGAGAGRSRTRRGRRSAEAEPDAE